jgi:hypothetical protein
MCIVPAIAAVGSFLGIGGATAAGATAAAGLTLGGALQAVGTVAGIAGTIYQNKQTKKYAAEQTAYVTQENEASKQQIARQAEVQTAAVNANVKEQTAVLQEQAATERQLTGAEDYQRRREFSRAIAQQRADLAARGVSLDSPTAILLGEQAAIEMSYESQAVRAAGDARQREIAGGLRSAALDAQTQLADIQTGTDANLTNIRLSQQRTLADIRANAKSSRLQTTTSAVASVLNSAPKIWPGLSDLRLGQKMLT